MIEASVHSLNCHGMPLVLCRTTNAATPIALTVSMVSFKLSPLFTLDVDTLKVIVSADRRLAAVSKLIRVRVESSKNKQVERRGTFYIIQSKIYDLYRPVVKVEGG